MAITIRETGPNVLNLYVTIPIRFQVETCFRIKVLDRGLGGLRLTEAKVDPAYTKDYDAQADDASPVHWPDEFDLSHWGIFLAWDGDRPVGGTAVALHTPGVHMLEERDDLDESIKVPLFSRNAARLYGLPILEGA